MSLKGTNVLNHKPVSWHVVSVYNQVAIDNNIATKKKYHTVLHNKKFKIKLDQIK